MESPDIAAGCAQQFLAISDSPSFFVQQWKEPFYLRQLKAMTGRDEPRIVFVGAANGDSVDKQVMFYKLADRVPFRPAVLSLFALNDDNPESFFAGADAIYIDGGSTRNLLALLREWGADQALRSAYADGVVIAGASAGANLMFEWGMTDSVRTRIDAVAGMGLVKGSISVHHNVRRDRQEAFKRHLGAMDDLTPSYILCDGAAIRFLNGKPAETFGVVEIG